MKLAIACAMIVSLMRLPAAAFDSTPPPSAPATNAALQPGAAPDTAATLAPIASAATAPAAPLPNLQPVIMAVARPVPIENRHVFFDLKNCVALAALGAGLTGDALSTQKGLGLPGFHEMNPIARPFVQNRPGAALYGAASFGFLGGSMYLAHKTNHHKLERVLPFAVAGWEGFLTFRNYHLISSSTSAH
jgi:hypothetical protein